MHVWTHWLVTLYQIKVKIKTNDILCMYYIACMCTQLRIQRQKCNCASAVVLLKMSSCLLYYFVEEEFLWEGWNAPPSVLQMDEDAISKKKLYIYVCTSKVELNVFCILCKLRLWNDYINTGIVKTVSFSCFYFFFTKY